MWRRAGGSIAKVVAFAAVLLGLAATPAAGAPSLGVELTRDEAVVSRSDERVDYTATVRNTAPAGAGNETSGLVTLEIELPAGQLTYAYKAVNPANEGTAPNGWSCETVPPSGVQSARVICHRSDSLPPGGSYPVVGVITALGADAPDLAVARATVAGGGTASATSDTDEFAFVLNPFGFASFDTAVLDEAGDDYTQAGGHPHTGLGELVFATKRALNPSINAPRPVEHLKQVFTDLPRGLVGNPLAVPELCAPDGLLADCPAGSVVGGVVVVVDIGGALSPIWAIEPAFGTAAQFVFVDVAQNRYTLSARLRPDDGYAASLDLAPAPASVEARESTVTICSLGGRQAGGNFAGCKNAGDSDVNTKPLLTNPTRCEGQPTTRVRMNSWENHSLFAKAETSDPPNTGCEAVGFDPSMTLAPTSTGADSPSGLDVSLSMPSDGLEDPDGISQAHLKKTVVELPDGVSVNPSAAAGLEGCSDAQLGLGTDSEPTCPDGSKIATVTATTPVLEETLTGSIVLRTPKSTDPQSGEMFRMALIVRNRERGILVKLPGSAVADPETGRLTATFDENPEQPIGRVDVQLKSGDRGVLAMPQRCGEKTIGSVLSPWKGDANVNAVPKSFSEAFTVGGDCSFGFAPKLADGMDTRQARSHGQFSFRFARSDGEQRLRGLTAKLPTGLLASVKGVPLCKDAQAAAGTCSAASKIGIVDAAAGAGNPFVLEEKGEVFLTEGYKGGAYGLAVKVRAIAGPFRGDMELKTIIVRQAIHVDRKTGQVTAVSDPFPQVWHGVPLRVREVTVLVNRDKFMLNPSDCEAKTVNASIVSAQGTVADRSVPFQASGCAKLRFRPRLAMRLTGRKQIRTGRHPGIRAVVRQQGIPEAGIEKAVVRLPKSLALDVDNAQALCEFEDGIKPDLEKHCPKGSIVGRARAVTPLLNRPLVGNVYFVKNVRIDKDTGNAIRTLPMIVVALRGEIAVNLVGESSTTRSGKLVNTFDDVPDAPISRFNLNIRGGSNGILAVTRTRRSNINLCAKPNGHVAEADMDGQNGRRHDFDVRMKTPCRKRRQSAAKRRAAAKRKQAAANRRASHG
jgi:hypothetical protein